MLPERWCVMKYIVLVLVNAILFGAVAPLFYWMSQKFTSWGKDKAEAFRTTCFWYIAAVLGSSIGGIIVWVMAN